MLQGSVTKYAYYLRSATLLFCNLFETVPNLGSACLRMPTDVDLIVAFSVITFRPWSSLPPGIESIGICPAVDDILLSVTNSFQIATQIARFIREGTGGGITMARRMVMADIIIVNRRHLWGIE